MQFDEATIMRAFHVYQTLSRDGTAGVQEVEAYSSDSSVRRLLDSWVQAADCRIISAGDRMHLVPVTKLSPFHMKNESIRTQYMKKQATNAELYTMYLAVLVLFGTFYDSYSTKEATRDFLPMEEWAREVTRRIEFLQEHDHEALAEREAEYSYNWRLIIETWEALDDVKEGVRQQDSRTKSRMGFLDMTLRFLQEQGLAEPIGNEEIRLSEKAKTIVQSYFMDYEYNRGILDFLYEHEWKEEEA